MWIAQLQTKKEGKARNKNKKRKVTNSTIVGYASVR